ncbi:Retrovirus-related Pol polyprotein from transposon 17.6-like protein, partial [Dinothrombium tinctorium]
SNKFKLKETVTCGDKVTVPEAVPPKCNISSALFVPVKVNNFPTIAIFDTGAGLSVVSEAFKNLIKIPRKGACNIKVRTVNNDICEATETVSFVLKLGKKKVNVSAVVLQNFPYNILIGNDVITKEKLILNFSDPRELRIDIPETLDSINAYTFNPENINLTVESSLTLQPYTSSICSLIVKQEPDLTGDYEVKLNEVYSMNGLVSVLHFENGTALALLSNSSEIPLIIKRGKTIGKIFNKFLDEPNEQIKIIEIMNVENINDTTNENESEFNISDFKISDDLNKENREKLESLITSYKDCFTKSLTKITETDVIEVNIETEGPPVKRAMYRCPIVHREPMKKILNELLKANVIRPSKSCYASPVLLRLKANGKDYRLLGDFRGLNATIKNDNNYPLPRIDDLIDSIYGSSVFSKLDSHSGFFTLRIAEKDKFKTAIITPYGLFEFNRLPQGLKISPNNFQMAMEKVYADVLFYCVLVYLDDCLIHSKNEELHFEHIRKTLDCVRKANIKLRTDKCCFFQREIDFLGHKISAKGIEINQDRVNSILKIKDPTNITEVKSFLGVLNYFRNHIKNFAISAEPLINLTRKKVKFNFEAEEKKAFDELKKSLCTAPILSFFDENLKTQLHTDASRKGIGAVLIQIDEKDSEIVIAYYSRTLCSAEKNYSGIELELLAIVNGIKRFHTYLLGRKFEIITDSSSLTYLMRVKDINSKLSRWAIFLQ